MSHPYEIAVTIGEKRHIAALPYNEAEYVNVHGAAPHCDGDKLQVYGGDITEGYDTMTAKAYCARCREHVGTIVVTVSTLFGIEEDRRVLQGRARVY